MLNINTLSSAAEGEVDKYKVISGLLMDAANETGVCCPQDAVNVWSKGLMRRSAAMQYSVMTTNLKKEYAKILEETCPNWVTGVSSPWIYSYMITEEKHEGDESYIYKLKYYTTTSAGDNGAYGAELRVIKQDGFWRISSIRQDEGLFVYTRYKRSE